MELHGGYPAGKWYRQEGTHLGSWPKSVLCMSTPQLAFTAGSGHFTSFVPETKLDTRAATPLTEFGSGE